MDDLLKQFAGADPKMMEDIMKQINGETGPQQEIAELPEDVKMENAFLTHGLFIQNQLKHTSHSLEWLPISHVCEFSSKLTTHYFILGTHKEQTEEPDKLQLYSMNIPNVRVK